MNFESEKELLKLKREIVSKGNNIYFETRKIKNLSKVEYRIRKSSPLSETPDLEPYKKYIEAAKRSLSTQFKNLSKDTILSNCDSLNGTTCPFIGFTPPV